MDAMPRPRPPYLSREVTRHGKPVWYVRVDGKRTRLRAEYGTAEFEAQYRAALTDRQKHDEGKAGTGSLAWLIERYRETTAWHSLSATTRLRHERFFRQACEKAGKEPFARITKATIAAARDRRAKTPYYARHFLDAMRSLFRWAVEAGVTQVDPTVGVKNPKQATSDGFRPWTENDVAAYEKRWPLGTRQRVWLDVLLYTGLRRGDAVRLGRPHIRDGIASIKTEKTGTPIVIPILPVLARTLAAGPCGDLTFIAGAGGGPLTKASFSVFFREACHAAGVQGSAHGVRKIAATRAANAGATVAELEAIFGWEGGRMASLYTRDADRVRLAKKAMHKLVTENEEPTSIVAPLSPSVAPREKSK
jgi:integrase